MHAYKRQRHKKSVSEHPLCAWQSWKIPCTRRHDLQIHPLPVSWRVNCFRHFFQEFEAKKRKWRPFPIFSDIFLSWILNPCTPPYRNSCNRSRYLQPVQDLIRWGVKAKMSQSLTNFDWTQEASKHPDILPIGGLGMRHNVLGSSHPTPERLVETTTKKPTCCRSKRSKASCTPGVNREDVTKLHSPMQQWGYGTTEQDGARC